MDDSDRLIAIRYRDGFVAAVDEVIACSKLPDSERESALLELFALPKAEALLRPGEAAGLSIKERTDEAIRLGLVFSRDVSHGKLYRHPVVSTWITCISQSPSDYRAGMNCASELRDGWREARDAIMRLADAVRPLVARPKETPDPSPEDMPNLMARARAYADRVTELGETLANRAELYNNITWYTEDVEKRHKELFSTIAKACAPTCTCDACQLAAQLKALRLSGSTPEGNQTFITAVRRAQRDNPGMTARPLLVAAGFVEPLLDVLTRIFTMQDSTDLPPEFATRVNAWVDKQREAARLEKEAKKAKYLPRTPQQKAQAWLDAPDVADATAMSDFLFAVNNMKKVMDAEVLRYKKDLKDAHAIIQDLINASVDTTALDAAKAEIVTARAAAIAAEQQAASATAATARAIAAEEALRALQKGVARLLAEISSKTEGVRALRLTEDLTSITDHLLNGAIALGVDVQSN